MRIIIRAPLLSVSGYGVHSRQIFKYLEGSKFNFDIETQIVNWGNTPWFINPDFEDGIIGRIMSLTEKKEEIADISFQVQLPDEWDSNLARINVGISAVVETDKCSTDWVKSCNQMDAIIVPSDHAKSCLESSGDIEVPIHIVPEWFFEEIETSDFSNNEFTNKDFDTDFNFLILSQLTGQTPETDRKNIMYTMKWLCEAFQGDPEVGIIIKTNQGRGTTIDRELTHNLIRRLISEVRVGEYPKVHIVHGNLYPEEVSGLYRNKSVKGLVSLTRGEGFGLPILESAASDLPVIATDWSAHTEFLSLGKFLKISYDLIAIPESKVDNRIFKSGFKWADPHEKDFKKKVKKFKNKYEMPQKWATSLGKEIRREYSRESISKIYDKVIGEILE
jgi:glycosyltransferase involved in cell wall biosynthesis